jgi:membrane protease YdiL (CAAX protease family)
MPPNADPKGIALLGGLMLFVIMGSMTAWASLFIRLVVGARILPARPWPWVRWKGTAVIGTFILWLAANVGAGQALSAAGGGKDLSSLDKMAVVSLVNLVLIAVLPKFLSLWSPNVWRDLGVQDRSTWAEDAALGVGATLFLMPIVYLVQFLAVLTWGINPHPVQNMLMTDVKDPKVALLAIIGAVILAPIVEELMFRGIFQGWLERLARPHEAARYRQFSQPEVVRVEAIPAVGSEGADPFAAPGVPIREGSIAAEPIAGPAGYWIGEQLRPGPLVALLLPAGIFAGVHYAQWPAPVPLFVLALGLGVVYRRTSSLIGPIAMHATFNGISTIAMILAAQYNLIPPDRFPVEVPPIPAPAPVPVPEGEAGTTTTAPALVHRLLNLHSGVEFFLAGFRKAD